MTASLHLARGALDCFADSHIGAAAADIPGHCCVDVSVVGTRILGQQCRRRHDLPRLAVTALNYFLIEPGLLHFGARLGRADSLDCGNRTAANRSDRQKTRAHRITVNMHGAGPALGDAATVFGSSHAKHIAQHPEQGSIATNVDVVLGSIDANRKSHDALPAKQVRSPVNLMVVAMFGEVLDEWSVAQSPIRPPYRGNGQSPKRDQYLPTLLYTGYLAIIHRVSCE